MASINDFPHSSHQRQIALIAFFVYVCSFPLGYLSVYFSVLTASVLGVFIVCSSYFLIIVKNRLYPVVFLIVYARCINGFVVPGEIVAFKFLNIATGYLPLLLSVAINSRISIKNFRYLVCKKYLFTTCYLVILLLYLLPDIASGLQFFIPRVLPMLMLVVALVFIRDKIEWREITLFFRLLFTSFVVVYLQPGYLERSYDLLASGVVFSKPLVEQSLVMMGVPRMLGSFWDFRITGIFGVVFGLIAYLQPRYRFKRFDILLAAVIVILSMSRGAMVLGGFVAVGIVLHRTTSLSSLVTRGAIFLCSLLVIGGVFILTAGEYSDRIISSFDPSNNSNALSQRGGFRDYALESFISNPIGGGVGHLKSDVVDRNILVGEAYYPKASDAFIFIQLAELGVIGFAFFVLSLLELLSRKNSLSFFLIVGFLVQMTGTDIPDMGIFYFLMLFIIVSLFDRFKARDAQSKNTVLDP